MTKPHLQIFTLYGLQNAALQVGTLHKETPKTSAASLQTELFSLGLSVISPENAAREITQHTQDARGLILWYYTKHPLSPSVGEALLFAKHAQLPLLLVVLLHDPSHATAALEEHEGKLREYLSALGLEANEIPILSYLSLSLEDPPPDFVEALELAVQRQLMPRWTALQDQPLRLAVLDTQPKNILRLAVLEGTLRPGQEIAPVGAPPATVLRCALAEEEAPQDAIPAPTQQALCELKSAAELPQGQLLGAPGALRESRQLYAQLYALPVQQGPLYAPPQKELLIEVHRLFSCDNNTIEISEGKARMFLIPPTPQLVPGSQASALLTFPKNEHISAGLRVRSFAKDASGAAPSFKVGDGFRWECKTMAGFGVVTKLCL